MPPISRRTLLDVAVRGAVGASLGAFAWRAGPARADGGDGKAVALGDGLHVLTLGESNVLALAAGDGVALVDGGSAAQSAALLKMVAALPGSGEVHTLFNTHWHPEVTGSNEALGKAGATIISQVNTRQWLTEDVTWPWNNETVQPLPAIARPGKTFYEKDEFTVAGRKVQCGHLRDCPHTDGDLYAFFPEHDVLAVGGAVYGAGWPDIDWWTGGWIGGIVGGLEVLLTVAQAGTKIVPAQGPLLTRADLELQHRMYETIWERLVKILYSGGGPKEALDANPTQEFDGRMGHSDAFVRRAFESLWAYLSPDA